MSTWWVKEQLKVTYNGTNPAYLKPRDFSKQ